jgi:methionine synthase II (cobalamin-independent)
VGGGDSQRFPWPAGCATGIGSMPGTDPAEACRMVLGELPDLPHLPELPARGAGADMLGRTAALLVDLHVDTTARGWKFVSRPGKAAQRADSYLAWDLDALQEQAEDYSGPVKLQLAGPWTLAAGIELARSQEPALADPGAVADVTASLAEGVAAHIAEVRKRISGARVIMQFDEPSLPAVLAGRVPTASGLNLVRAIEPADVTSGLREVLTAAATTTVVHCCAAAVPFPLLRDAGATAVSFDLSLLATADYDLLAELAEAGLGLFAGALPTSPLPRIGRGGLQPKDTATEAITMWRRMGLAATQFGGQVVITPACGLAGASVAAARSALAHCREAARMAPELIEEGAS